MFGELGYWSGYIRLYIYIYIKNVCVYMFYSFAIVTLLMFMVALMKLQNTVHHTL